MQNAQRSILRACCSARTRSDGGTPFLFGLAPCGVCHARSITGAAVRSYRTFSPLPLRAVYFLWHFPSTDFEIGFPDVIRHTALWSSDFPPFSLDARRATVRPSCLHDYYRRPFLET